MKANDYITALAARGRHHFLTGELAQATGSSENAARAAIRRLRTKGLIATPYRGYHVIVPPEYRSIGCLPAEQFIGQLMDHLGLSYYAALLSAARYHGAAHQQPQVFQVMVKKNRPPIECGRVRVNFIARNNVDDIPVTEFNTPRGHIFVPSPEATAFDLIGYPAHAGGLENVAVVLAELSESIDPNELKSVAPLSPVPWSQRLGYLFGLLGLDNFSTALIDYLSGVYYETVPFAPGVNGAEIIREPRWKLYVNTELEPDY